MALDFRATQIEVHKLIASGALNNKTKLLFYPFSAASNLSGGINQTVFNTSSLGSDFWAFFSGAIRSKGVNALSGVVGFGGDVYVSGALYAENGFSGSLQRLVSGEPYLVAGPNITITTQSNGAIVISGSAGASSGSMLSFGLCDFGTTSLVDYTAVGQIVFNSNLYSGSINLRASLTTTNGAVSSSIKLWSFTDGGYVDINGVGVKTLSTVSTTPVVLQSTDLRNATNFTSNGQGVYEIQLASQTAATAVYVGGAEFRVTGSLGTGEIAYLTCGLYRTALTTPSAQNAIIYTFPMPNSSCIDFDADVIAVADNAAFNRARYRRNLLAYKSGSAGSATIEGGTVYATVTDLESSGSWDYNIQAIGSNIQFEVTGSATENITWKLRLIRNELP